MSILQSIIVVSIIEVVYMTLTESMQEVIWLKGLLDDLNVEKKYWRIIMLY